MTQAQKINKALIERVVPALIEDGFVGKFPHYKKVCEDHIKFLSFDKDKYGNAFRVAAAIVFPNEPPERTNINYSLMEFNGKSDLTTEELDIGYCFRPYFLRGNRGDDFCYSDVYWDFFLGMENRVSDKRAKNYKKKWYEIKLQSGGDATNEKICELINKRLPKVYKWWEKEIKKRQNSIDKIQVDQEYIENQFEFLINSGYAYKFYQKYGEREFIYTLEECCIEVYLNGQAFDCVIRTKDFPRSNITKNPLVRECFKEQFFKANTIQRIDMAVNFLRENSDVFLLK